jgi:hypothetical protein
MGRRKADRVLEPVIEHHPGRTGFIVDQGVLARQDRRRCRHSTNAAAQAQAIAIAIAIAKRINQPTVTARAAPPRLCARRAPPR